MTNDRKEPTWGPVRIDDLMANTWDKQADLLPPSKSELAQRYRETAQYLRKTLNTKMIRVVVEP